MFAKKVFVQQDRLHCLGRRMQAQGFASEFYYVLEHGRVMNGLRDRFAPSERAMARNQNGGARKRVASGKGFDNHMAGIGFVIVLDFLLGQKTGARHGPVEIIGMSGA